MPTWLKFVFLIGGLLVMAIFAANLQHIPEDRRPLRDLQVGALIFMAIGWIVLATR